MEHRVSHLQVEELVHYLMAHPSLVKGVGLGARSKENIDREWSNLASKLNAHGEGATKTGQRWKRYWADLKFKVKTKAAQRRKEASGTGGGPATQPDLTELDKKILSIIGEGAVHGDSEHRVPILISLPSNKTVTQGTVEVTVNTTESPPPSVPASFYISPSTRGHTSIVDTTEATVIAPGSPHRPATSRRILDTTEATAVAPGSPRQPGTSRRFLDILNKAFNMSAENEEHMENSSSDSEDESMDEEERNNEEESEPKTYLPGLPLQEDEHLICDQSAYVMLHQAQTGAPCLSFDIITDNLGNDRQQFPMTAYLVAGTQASSAHLNNVLVVKMSNLHPTSKPEDEDESDDDDAEDDEEEDDEKKPQMTFSFIKHQGCVNRIRATNFKNSVLAASWSELGNVDIWNITQQLQAVDEPALLERYNLDSVNNPVKPLFSFSGHQQEGFGIAWCPTEQGVLATGDCRRDIHIWKPNEGGTWTVDQRPLVGHTSSVEDIQWSPNERNVLATCSVDRTIRIWDSRAAPHKACMLVAENAHEKDINVLSWNSKEPFIASGGDDGFLHIWDLRQFPTSTPVGTFKHHTAPITSVEWHWTEPSVLASAGEDNQVALWDLAVERDDEEVVDEELKNLPPQLLFIHQGQTDIKELHWHKQLPGVIVTTAHTGFNIFKTISV